MKKFLMLLMIFLLLFSSVGCSVDDSQNYLRIHIRANSNSQSDQQIKQKVKDEIVSFLTPILSVAKDKNQAATVVLSNIDEICKIADNVLSENGFDYLSSAEIKKEKFPTRKYGDLVLYDGEYDALIINLGEGVGDNWWCVVYPPLCFVGGEYSQGEKVVYKSRLEEFLDWLL